MFQPGRNLEEGLHQEHKLRSVPEDTKLEKAPILKGVPYLIERRSGKQPNTFSKDWTHIFEIWSQSHQLESLKRGPSLMPVPINQKPTALKHTLTC